MRDLAAQVIGGHPVDKDQDAIRWLGLWTILDLRWPLLAEHLARHPEHVALLKRQEAPTSVSDGLKEMFEDPGMVDRLAGGRAQLR